MSSKLQRGFSLLETMVALAILLGVGGIVMSGMIQLMKTQNTIGNRTEMHTSVRSATELLQQEIGQAGKMSLAPPNVNVTMRSEENTSELQSLAYLVCRLLLEKKNH